VDAVDEFKRCCISSETLLLAAKQTEGGFSQKLEELSLILETYDSLCSRGKRDPRDQMTWLLEQLEDSNYGEEHVFYIDGFPDLTRQHFAILMYLIQVSPNVTISLNCDHPGSNVLSFEKAGNTASELIRGAKQAGIDVEIRYIQAGKRNLLPVYEKLFQGSTDKLESLDGKLLLSRSDSLCA